MENENKVEVAQNEQIKNETPAANNSVEAKVSDTQNQNSRGDRGNFRGNGNRNPNDRRNGGRRSFNRNGRRNEPKEFEERVVYINKVCKVVKGGKRLKFSALVVIGNHKGKYGFAMGKSAEVPDAIKKAVDRAKRNLYTVHIVKASSIAHDVIGKFGATEVFLKPAPEGTGIIAGRPVRSILELCGITNVYSKTYGSRTSINVIRATNAALSQLKEYKEVQELRGLSHEEGAKENVK